MCGLNTKNVSILGDKLCQMHHANTICEEQEKLDVKYTEILLYL